MKKLIKLIKKLFLKFNYIFYVGSSDILPPPLDEQQAPALSNARVR